MGSYDKGTEQSFKKWKEEDEKKKLNSEDTENIIHIYNSGGQTNFEKVENIKEAKICIIEYRHDTDEIILDNIAEVEKLEELVIRINQMILDLHDEESEPYKYYEQQARIEEMMGKKSEPPEPFILDLTPLENCKNLKKLAIVGLSWDFMYLENIKQLANCFNLEHLRLHKVGFENDSNFKELNSLSSLDSIVISDYDPSTIDRFLSLNPDIKVIKDQFADFIFDRRIYSLDHHALTDYI